MMNKSHRGYLLKPVTSKRVGVDECVLQPENTKCRVHRNQACLGEFIIKFRGNHYAKINAIELPNVVYLVTGGGL